ncbi:hypothetical protein GCM10008018_65260 [Paenibacillus marchantiophytorum]|uniref:Uncharacterized protein n=1 Tax=Paenibacillus marchantiophytorum TaxID=1619310 RepID=A0ABQ1FFP3_9BACL|nr:hypothetical protein GCM10008018_65260 [Paenibacillus marchantiophytorum]
MSMVDLTYVLRQDTAPLFGLSAGTSRTESSFTAVRHSTNVMTPFADKDLKSIPRITATTKFLYLFYHVGPNMFFIFFYKGIPVPPLIEKNPL